MDSPIHRMFGVTQNNMPTLRELIDYSKANPNSDVAKNTYLHIKDGSFDQQAQIERIDLSWAGRPTTPTPPAPTPDQGTFQANKGIFGANPILPNILNSLTSSEQNLGKDIGRGVLGGDKYFKNITDQYTHNVDTLMGLAAKQSDPALKQKYMDMAKQDYEAGQQVGADFKGRTWEQIAGDTLGTALDVALVAAPLLKGAKVVTPLAEGAIKKTTGEVVKGIVKETAINAAKGAGIGYGFDVSKNLQEGKTGGEALKPGLTTAIGAGVPLVIGGIKIGATALKNSDTAGRVVNSLIKPLQEDFAYGKNPGKAIAEAGITANSLDELGSKVKDAKIAAGQELGKITSSLEGKATLDFSSASEAIDKAIEEAQKAPETNKALISRLQGVRSDLMNYIGDGKNLTFAEGIDTKGLIGDITKWTGNPSDDKIVNKALKQTYGIINNEIMDKVKSIDPEIAKDVSKLNDKYGNMIAAENAINHRDMILQRQNLVSMPIKVGTAAGLITEVASGGNPIASILTGVTFGVLDKALASPAFKTRIASWLATESPGVVDKLYKANPAIRNILIKLRSNPK